MNGIPVLVSWDMEIKVLHSAKNRFTHMKYSETSCAKEFRSKNLTTEDKRTSNRDLDELSYSDQLITNANSFQCNVQLYIFENNETVIKMIIKGRSPMMRHVSRIHGVALDWLIDRVILDRKIHNKYVDIKNHLTEMLTKENFILDEWNHLLRFIIMSFSTLSSIHFL